MICPEDLASLAICRECQHPFWIDYCAEGRPREFCSPRCRDRASRREWKKTEGYRISRARERHVRRARKAGQPHEPFNPFEIYARDGWVCQICKKKIPKRVRFPDPRSPSLDHIVPLSQGGSHSKANVQMVHLGCNTRKGVGGVDQLRLLG